MLERRVQFVVSALFVVIFLRMVAIFLQYPVPSLDRAWLREVWLHSQYNLDEGYEFFGNMSDEDLRSYAALEYIRGADPSVVNFEDPPLGKYLLGFSYLLSGNILLIQFLASVLVLVLVYVLSYRLSHSPILSIVPPFLLVFDRLYLERSTSVNLDLLQLLFSLIVMVILIGKFTHWSSSLVLGLSIGAVMATKVVFVGILLLFYAAVILLLQRPSRVGSRLFVMMVSALAVYLSSYAVYFAYHSVFDFFKLHLSIVRLYRSYLPEYPWFEIWRILLLGQWRTWFSQPPIQPVAEFWIGWPVATLLSGSLLLAKRTWRLPLSPVSVLLFWVLLYLFFQSVHVVFPRYLLMVLPLLYLLAVERVRMLLKSMPPITWQGD